MNLPVSRVAGAGLPAGLDLNQLNGGAAAQKASEAMAPKSATGVKGDADVRNRLLVEVQARILAGEYNTRAAVEQAAQQITGL